jgi:4-alpha-glucanotransferase
MSADQTRRRRAVVLMPLFSLRAEGLDWGVGEIPDIPVFAAWARAAGFSALQLLPVGEVCGGETSPYAASTAFALDPIYLGLDACEDFRLAGGREALAPADRALLEQVSGARQVAWHEVRGLKWRGATLAFERFLRDEWNTGSARRGELERFREEHGAAWLDDYALFAVLHDRFHKSWLDWPTPLRDRAPEALEAARTENAQAILQRQWLQWQLDLQWHQARSQAAAHGVDLMGDLPFVVSQDSADVWSRRDDFRVDMRVGTPPDAFSAEGQDWGLPLYDWDRMEASGFGWIKARADRAASLYALYRVDHVIGLYRTFYRSADGQTSGFVPAEEARQIALGETLMGIMGQSAEVVAEDLGMVPEFLRPSLTRLGVPGYRVLRWEKDEVVVEGEQSANGDGNGNGQTKKIVYRDPAQWPENSVAASSTHDIETHAEWYDTLPGEERAALAQVPGLEALAAPEHQKFDDVVRDALLRALYAAPSTLVAIPFQDALGSRERVNVPGTVADTNWTYRMPMNLASLGDDRATVDRLARLAADTGRTPTGEASGVPGAGVG